MNALVSQSGTCRQPDATSTELFTWADTLMAERLAPADYDQLHHFIAAGVWDAAPLERELLVQADRLVGGGDAVLVIDDTAVPKKGTHSVGVSAQYASALGKTANCQTLVSLTLARGEVPLMVALRLTGIAWLI